MLPLSNRKPLLYTLLIVSITLIGLTAAIFQSQPSEVWASSACDLVTEIPVSECQALASLYNSTDGPLWYDNYNWVSSYTPCYWSGVSCSGGHVTGLSLYRNNLRGLIPTEIDDLPYLTYLNLSGNNLKGPIATTVGNLGQLTILSLHSNALDGNIPSEIGNLQHLTELSLSGNHLSGAIPESLGQLTNLTTLFLGNNQLDGSIPPQLGNLTGLTGLSLENNKLSGNIPLQLEKLNQLDSLSLSGNQLSGPIPPEIGNWTWLLAINLSDNQLTGPIPESFRYLTALTHLNLSRNHLAGEIPAGIGDLTQLINLDLSGNHFSGAIPSSLENLSQLSKLSLAGNSLTGQIPAGLGMLNNLGELDLNGNLLEGPLPLTFLNLHVWEFNTYNTNLCNPPVLDFWLHGLWRPRTTNISCESPQAEVKRRGVAVASVRDQPSEISDDSRSLEQAKKLNMDVVYYPLGWDQIEVRHNEYDWRVLGDILEQAKTYDVQVVLRIYNPPPWRTPDGAPAGVPPANPDDLREFMRQLVNTIHNGYYDPEYMDYVPGRPEVVAGYVIWNEPNIRQQWGGQSPDPAAYLALLKAAYEGTKSIDPGAVIVSAPLAPTADSPGEAINDLTYLDQLYDLGLINYANVIGLNGLGFQHDPDHDSGHSDYNFMRLKYLHDLMVAKGDTAHPVWALETGWLQDSGYPMGSFEQFKVSQMEQARYLARAIEKANDEWPWLDMAVIWNLDFNRYYPPTSNFHWYSISNNGWANILLAEASSPEYRNTFDSTGGYWSPKAGHTIAVGAGVIENTAEFILTTYETLKDIAVDGFQAVGVNFSLEAIDENGPIESVFSSPIYVALEIPDQVQNPQSVSLFTYRNGSGWVDACREPGNSCVITGTQLHANLSHFSDFSMGVTQLYYFPIIVKQ